MAVAQARVSPCANSKRGAVVYLQLAPEHPIVVGQGHNGPPGMIACDGSERCRASCRSRCEHAETRAITDALRNEELRDGYDPMCDIVHVKIGADGNLVAGGPPSCMSCAVTILDVGLGGVWLYEEMPEDWCPHLDMLRTACPLCQGESCDLCHPGYGRPVCEHDVLDRHHGHPIVDARWRRYTAIDFHRSTRRHEGVY